MLGKRHIAENNIFRSVNLTVLAELLLTYELKILVRAQNGKVHRCEIFIGSCVPKNISRHL